MSEKPRDATLARAVQLVEILMDGPADYLDLMDGLHLTNPGTFRNTLKLARDVVGPQHGMTIPRPVAEDGYLYRLTADWIDPDDPAIRDGVKVQTSDCRARVVSIIRDLEIARDSTDGRTAEGRKVRQYLDVMAGARAGLDLVDQQLEPVAVTNGSNN
jgi:hypothetical protein